MNHLAHFRRRSFANARRGASGHFFRGTTDRRPTDDRPTTDRRPTDDRPTTHPDGQKWWLHFRKFPLHFFPTTLPTLGVVRWPGPDAARLATFGQVRPTDDRPTTDRRPMDDRPTTDGRTTDDRPTTDRRPTDDRPTTDPDGQKWWLHFRKFPLRYIFENFRYVTFSKMSVTLFPAN